MSGFITPRPRSGMQMSQELKRFGMEVALWFLRDAGPDLCIQQCQITKST